MAVKEDGLIRKSSLIVRPENGGILDLIRLLLFGAVGSSFIECHYTTMAKDQVYDEDDDEEDVLHRIVCFVSVIIRKILGFFEKPLEWIGNKIEYLLNLFSLNYDKNEYLFSFIFRLLRGGKDVVKPKRGTETFISAVGHLDGRIDLYKNHSSTNPFDSKLNIEDRVLIDLSIMSAKLAYENKEVVRHVVDENWKMHFVDFYDCWNDFQRKETTHAFIFCDKKTDANLIVISFRGTDPFSADNWSTDIDYTWNRIPKHGKIHMGFIEAMGLGNRVDTRTITDSFLIMKKTPTDKDSRPILSAAPHMADKTAYYTVRRTLKRLLKEHKNAKFLVTGHSLGGALAIVFPVLLLVNEENDIMERLLGVHTYGQPRIGNKKLCHFVNKNLLDPNSCRYLRFVYCNDLVPRLPYDDHTFLYKHCGVCIYYDSNYNEQIVDDEPNPNYHGWRFLIPKYLNAWYELIRSFRMGQMYGRDYEENWLSIVMRFFGLVFPGLSAHCPINYVNSVRLGSGQNIID